VHVKGEDLIMGGGGKKKTTEVNNKGGREWEKDNLRTINKIARGTLSRKGKSATLEPGDSSQTEKKKKARNVHVLFNHANLLTTCWQRG